jgi:hypothetical protein
MWTEAVMTYAKVLSWHLPDKITENPGPRETVCGPTYEPDRYRTRSRGASHFNPTFAFIVCNMWTIQQIIASLLQISPAYRTKRSQKHGEHRKHGVITAV